MALNTLSCADVPLSNLLTRIVKLIFFVKLAHQSYIIKLSVGIKYSVRDLFDVYNSA